MRYVLTASAQDDHKKQTSSTLEALCCNNPYCTTQQNGRPRRANKACVHDPPLCLNCCHALGVKCKAHRSSAVGDKVRSLFD